MIAPVPPDWWIPEKYDGQPVSPEVRQLLHDLSLICRSPEVHGLTLELETIEQLLRLLATPDGAHAANFAAVQAWINQSGAMGETSDHAPDDLVDIYADLGLVDDSELSREGGTTPQKLLERLRRVRNSEKS